MLISFLILFGFIVLVALGLVMLIIFLKSDNKTMKKIVVLVSALVIVIGCFYVFFGRYLPKEYAWFSKYEETDIWYNINTYDAQFKVEIIDTIKEKDKEEVYKIHFSDTKPYNNYADFTTSFTKSEYEKKIGSGNTHITITVSCLSLETYNFKNKLDTAVFYGCLGEYGYSKGYLNYSILGEEAFTENNINPYIKKFVDMLNSKDNYQKTYSGCGNVYVSLKKPSLDFKRYNSN